MKLTERTDTDLEDAVLDEIARLPSVNSAHIAVAVNHGTVVLSGEVDSGTGLHQTQTAALGVRGVHAVVEKITVPGRTVTDCPIARQAHRARHAHEELQSGPRARLRIV